MSNLQWDVHNSQDGQTYFYNKVTGETSWEHPDLQQQTQPIRQVWEPVWSEEQRRYYYHNKITGETQWENPDEAGELAAGTPAPASSVSAEQYETKVCSDSNDLVEQQTHPPAYVEYVGEQPTKDQYAAAGNWAQHYGQPEQAQVQPVEDQCSAGDWPYQELGVQAVSQPPLVEQQHAGEGWTQQRHQHPQQGDYSSHFGDSTVMQAGSRCYGGEMNGACPTTSQPAHPSLPTPSVMSMNPRAASVSVSVKRVPSARRIDVSPPTDKAKSILQDALKRKEESLRRLEEAREAARARAAAAAEAKAEREAKKATTKLKPVKPSATRSSVVAGNAGGVSIVLPARSEQKRESPVPMVRGGDANMLCFALDTTRENIVSHAQPNPPPPPPPLSNEGAPSLLAMDDDESGHVTAVTSGAREGTPPCAGHAPVMNGPTDAFDDLFTNSTTFAGGNSSGGPLVGLGGMRVQQQEGELKHDAPTEQTPLIDFNSLEVDGAGRGQGPMVAGNEEPSGWVVVGAADMSSSADARVKSESCSQSAHATAEALPDDSAVFSLQRVGDLASLWVSTQGSNSPASDTWPASSGDVHGQSGEAEAQEAIAGWDEVSLLGVEADEEVALVRCVAAIGGKDLEPVGADDGSLATAALLEQSLSVENIGGEATPNLGSPACDNTASPGVSGDGVQISPVLLKRAVTRVARLLELLGSIDGEEAWAGRIRCSNHLACSRLVDYVALGSYLLGYANRSSPLSAVASGQPNSGSQVPSPPTLGPELILESHRLCRSALECLGISGRISPSMWVDLARAYHDGKQCAESTIGDSRLAQVISLCVALAAKVGREQGPDDNLAEESGCNQVVEDYKWRGKYEHPGDGAAKDEDRAEDEDTGKAMRRLALVLIFEALAGCARAGIKNLAHWDGMKHLVQTLMDVVLEAEEGSYLQATKGLLVVNDPTFREVPAAEPTTSGPSVSTETSTSSLSSCSTSTSTPSAASVVIPALSVHMARHEIQGAVLHILNEEGFPNGDPEVARLSLGFCADACEANSGAELFYINDIKVIADVIIRELHNLPETHELRAPYLRLLDRLMKHSQWATRSDRYREADLARASGVRLGSG